jgi:predicted Zn finger-like uncharacterized protein
MRLTCPNCGAQYEVPDEVIPNEGRDVQCSNCGDTWFHAHPDNPDTAKEPENAPEDQRPETARHVAPAPETDDFGDPHGDNEPPQNVPEPEPAQQEIDSGISDILREEAERETQLRAAESTETLESQPNLGLDDLSADGPDQRAQQARERMARMRGEPAQDPGGAAEVGSRRELLPNIEEINSTLRASEDATSNNTALGPVYAEEPQKRRSGFSRGFALVVVVGVIMAVIYVNAPKISGSVPQAEPLISSYVMRVDQARVWLDARLGEFVSKTLD